MEKRGKVLTSWDELFKMNLLLFQNVQFSIWSTTKSINWFSGASVVGELWDGCTNWVFVESMNSGCKSLESRHESMAALPMPESAMNEFISPLSSSRVCLRYYTPRFYQRSKYSSSFEQVKRIDDWSWSSDFGGGRHAADVVLIMFWHWDKQNHSLL